MALMALGLLLLVLGSGAVAAGGDKPLHLSDANFEHDTQAASGQTTGAWLVLFHGTAGSEQEDRRAGEALEELLGSLEGYPLVAKVNVSQSPKTAKRFSLSRSPYLKLFRNRRMFSYSADWSASSISRFVESAWKDATAEEVPPEPSLADELLLALRAKHAEWSQFLASHPVALACLAALVALASYASTSRLLAKAKKSR